MKIERKTLEEVRGAKSAEELKILLEGKNITLTEAQAEELFAKLPLNDDELEQVAGGISLHKRVEFPPRK